jgi:hypothetical protein
MKWKPIKTAPKDGTYILIYNPPRANDYEDEGIYIACWKQESYIIYRENDPWCWCVFGTYQDEQGGEITIQNPTHWMSLPTPPKQKRKK